MIIGYTDSGIKEMLEKRTQKYGTQWSITAQFEKAEWENALKTVQKSVTSKLPFVDGEDLQALDRVH